MPWTGDKAVANLRARAGRNVAAASYFLHGRVRELLNVPSRTVTVVKTKSGREKKVLGPRGGDPSKPGEPPHKDHGNLQRSVAVETDAENLVGRVGTASKVGRWLELGTTGGTIIRAKNKRVLANAELGLFFGKQVKQGPIAPRPFLRRALADNRAAILHIVANGQAPDGDAGGGESPA